MKHRVEIALTCTLLLSIGAGLWFWCLAAFHIPATHEIAPVFHDDRRVLFALAFATLPELGLLFIGVGIMAVIAGKWRVKWSDVGLNRPGIPLSETIMLLMLSCGAILAMDVLSGLIAPWWQSLLHIPPSDRASLFTSLTGLPLSRTFLCVYACTVAPFCEEVLFRGVLQRQFTRMGKRVTRSVDPQGRSRLVEGKGMPPWVAILLASLLFAVGHGDPANLLAYIGAGVVFGIVAQVSRSIWPSVIVHALVNLLFVLIVLIR